MAPGPGRGPRLTGAEALLRWPGPDGRPGGPTDVIEVAEETGQIVALGAQVLTIACCELARWYAAGHRLDLAVNLSARQLADPGLADDVERAIVTSGIDPGSLVLEVTETALMEDPDRALATLQRLRRIGARIAVDDFGTGYCSLSYLSAFPVQILKVDAAFVARMTTNQQDRTIVAAVIGLAHALGIVALGEGVESESQLEMLSELGCDAARASCSGFRCPAPNSSAASTRPSRRGRAPGPGAARR